jgi:predicted transcriptional regulator
VLHARGLRVFRREKNKTRKPLIFPNAKFTPEKPPFLPVKIREKRKVGKVIELKMARKQKLIDKLKEEKFSSVINAILKYGLTSHKTFASLADSGMDEKQIAYVFTTLQKLGLIQPIKSGAVYANAPMVGDNADRLQYKLDLKDNRFEVDEGRKEEYQKAILWLLNTFLFYPRELGLVDEPRKQR